NCGRRRRGHESAARRKIYPRADALLHALSWRRRNARRLFAGLSGIARLCAHARTISGRIFQCGRSRNARARVWPHTANESILSLRSAAGARNLALVQEADRPPIRTHISVASRLPLRPTMEVDLTAVARPMIS